MTNKDIIEYHKEITDKMRSIIEAKNSDYGATDNDAFSNFKAVEREDMATVEQGFLTRIMDKLNRIKTFIKKGYYKSDDEKIEDTVIDLANYVILLSGYIKSKQDEQTPFKTENGNLYIETDTARIDPNSDRGF